MKSNLFVNIGNTTTTFGFSEFDDINKIKFLKIETKKLKDESISKVLEELLGEEINNFKCAFISSVVSSLNDKFGEFFELKKIKFLFVGVNEIKNLDLSNLYNSYELGADIIAQLIYVVNFFEEAIVVSLGTASVIYHVKNSKLSGCIILPGINKSCQTINSTTDIANFDLIDTNKILGQNNSEAISIGILNTIKEQVNHIIKEMNLSCPVLVTGGNSKYFENKNWWKIENLEILGLWVFVETKTK